MLSRPRRLAVSTVVAACLLAGCQAPVSTPSPTPSFTCTPEAGGAEFSCSQHQYDDMVAKDKLYAEAEAVYRKFLVEEVMLLHAGGANEPTDVLTQTTSGAFLDDVMEELRHAKSADVSVSSGQRSIETIERLVGKSKGGSAVALAFCVDSTSVSFVSKGKTDGHGSVARDEVYFGRIEGALKAIGADGKEVPKC